WPGNGRELRNAVQAYAAIGALPEGGGSKSAMIRMALAEMMDVHRPFAEQRDELVELYTSMYLKELLAHTGGNQSLASRVSGIDRTYLGRLLVKYRLTKG